MKRLEKNHIYCIYNIRNHDFYQKERYWFSFPKMSIYLHPEDKKKIKSGETVSLSGFSYRQPWIQKTK